MSTEEHKPGQTLSPKREYPAAYERAVPVALALIALAIVILLAIIVVVALGLYPGA